jgi:hypothetical protein
MQKAQTLMAQNNCPLKTTIKIDVPNFNANKQNREDQSKFERQ